ncbi:hypothetical protein Leryth_023478 [Lithospermum erythrorhizon]|nr:hypothetical protein Leryth_023478 [Lithospermum erythrorhizon]
MSSSKDVLSGSHILSIPFPLQGHVNPVLQFSKLLASNGLKVTILTTTSTIPMSMQTETATSISFESIFDDPCKEIESKDYYDAFIKTFQVSVSRNLEKLVEKFACSGYPVKVIVYDAHTPWILELAHKVGIKGAAFYTDSCSVSAALYHFQNGTLKLLLEEGERSVVELPCLPEMWINDLPSFLSDQDSYPSLLEFVLFSNLNYGKADWLLFNTFDELEQEVVNWMRKQWPIKTIGPLIPSKYFENKLINDDKDYGLNLFSFSNSNCYMKWLDSKEQHSVAYVSFGSLSIQSEEVMNEIALGLQNSKCNFLWVVLESEASKLPIDFKAHQHLEGRGMIVSWCSQLEVLAHKSVGCFVTHSGWNSTLEALTLGVPMVAMPNMADQPTNAKFVVDVWGVGVRAKAGENGIVGTEEVEKCVKEVLEGDRRIELRQNALRWKKLANEAVNGGSSEKNFKEFISEVYDLDS